MNESTFETTHITESILDSTIKMDRNVENTNLSVSQNEKITAYSQHILDEISDLKSLKSIQTWKNSIYDPKIQKIEKLAKISLPLKNFSWNLLENSPIEAQKTVSKSYSEFLSNLKELLHFNYSQKLMESVRSQMTEF